MRKAYRVSGGRDRRMFHKSAKYRHPANRVRATMGRIRR